MQENSKFVVCGNGIAHYAKNLIFKMPYTWKFEKEAEAERKYLDQHNPECSPHAVKDIYEEIEKESE